MASLVNLSLVIVINSCRSDKIQDASFPHRLRHLALIEPFGHGIKQLLKALGGHSEIALRCPLWDAAPQDAGSIFPLVPLAFSVAPSDMAWKNPWFLAA